MIKKGNFMSKLKTNTFERELYKTSCDATLSGFLDSYKLGIIKKLGKLVLAASKMSQILKIVSRVAATQDDTESFLKELIKSLSLEYELDLQTSIPKSGTIIFVSNHPTGFCETILIPEILYKIRPDLKIIANQVLPIFPQTKDLILRTDVYSTSPTAQNVKILKETLQHLKDGGALLIFPAGAVGQLQNNVVTDTQWNKAFAQFALKLEAPIIPIHVSGKNPSWFYTLRKIHPILTTFFMPRMIFKKQKMKISILPAISTFGKTIETLVKLAYDASNKSSNLLFIIPLTLELAS
jgi:1-acyl-sn-glycerol-3-phosphate acyltransferase